MATFAEQHGTTIKDAWWSFHRQNPSVYAAFESAALRAIQRGKRKLSAKLICEVIRWEHWIDTKDATPFKLNNNYPSYYARLFMHYHPEYDGFFETRKLRST